MAGSRSTATLTVEQSGGVLVVSLDRPDQLNALNLQMQEELVALWTDVRRDSSVRCVVLTGSGRAFCAGADVSELETIARPGVRSEPKGLAFCPAAVVEVPVIVAINGLCVGGGLRFLADADIVLASEQAWFSDPHVALGQTSGPLALQLAAQTSSLAVAQLVLCGPEFRLAARDAQIRGLVNELLTPEGLLDRACALARMIAAQSPTGVRATVAVLRRETRESISGRLDDAWAAMVAQSSHADAIEGPAALAARRPPVWAEPLLCAPQPSTTTPTATTEQP